GRAQHRPRLPRAGDRGIRVLRRALRTRPRWDKARRRDRRPDRRRRRGTDPHPQRLSRGGRLPARGDGRMTLLAGALLGAGVLLTLAPWLWPASPARPVRRPRGALRALLDEAGLAEVPARTILVLAAACAVAAAAIAWLLSHLAV